jgi:hypothetical protein
MNTALAGLGSALPWLRLHGSIDDVIFFILAFPWHLFFERLADVSWWGGWGLVVRIGVYVSNLLPIST